MKNIFLALALLFSGFCFSQSTLKSPDEFLPYRLGDRFTPHHLLTDYFEYVADTRPDQVKLIPYGRTNEYRPLMIAVISTKENMARLEEIRLNNMRRTGLIEGNPAEENITFVWLSFSVHGNESSGSESSMQVIYDLLTTPECREWLKNTIVVIDPSLNPDGYNRYSNWNNQVSNRLLTPNPVSREHREPWPGGRANHYYFDLNRDWAWQTQVESQQRAKVYLQWMPHVHADLHEMGSNEPYYFAPAAPPYHEFITKWQSDFQVEIGKNNASHFDKNNWLYFTKEVFDLLYPSYGDTYPTYSGAVGMTYEQGGNSRAGKGIIVEMGDTLQLSDRIQHHRTAALSTVEVSSRNASALVRNFKEFYQRSNFNPPGKYKTYIVKNTNHPGTIRAFCDLLDKNQIRYGRAGQVSSVKAFNYATAKEESISVTDQDLIISAYQPLGLMAQILLDPEPVLTDSMTYDITAWSLICAYGLEAYASTQRIETKKTYDFPVFRYDNKGLAKPYAYVATWGGLNNARFLSHILRKGINARCAKEPFEINQSKFDAGSLIITRADNAGAGDSFDAIVQEVAREMNQEIVPVGTGFAMSGRDFGSDAVFPLNFEKVLLVYSDDADENAFGHLWHYFEQDLDYPLVMVQLEQLGNMALNNYDVIILPNGGFNADSELVDKIKDWVMAGGKLIAVEGGMEMLTENAAFKLKRPDRKDAESGDDKQPATPPLYGDRERQSISNSLPGAIIKTRLDKSHPIGFGMPDFYYSLKTGSRPYARLENGWNVAYVPENYLSYGFIGSRLRKNLENTMVIGEQRIGRGVVIYMEDSPMYRGFWHQGKVLFANALFFGGN